MEHRIVSFLFVKTPNFSSLAVFASEIYTSVSNAVLTERSIDLRDPSTTPLNFTRSINLALSERGMNSIRNARCDGLLENIIDKTVPMHGRMIHRQDKDGKLFQESQKYDAHGRVGCSLIKSTLDLYY